MGHIRERGRIQRLITLVGGFEGQRAESERAVERHRVFSETRRWS